MDGIASLAMVAALVPMASGEAMISAFGVGLIMSKAVGFN